jgi:hypothetical protein
MAIPRHIDTRETPAPLSSPGLEQTEEALSVPNEASSLLQAGREFVSPRSLSERCHSAVSAFLDKNAGLLLVAASQLFISASNVSVKYLNSLDEHVPMLEVRGALGGN